MSISSDITLLELLFKWVQETDKAAFKLEYGYGLVEEPWLVLSIDCKEEWSGTFQQYRHWASK